MDERHGTLIKGQQGPVTATIPHKDHTHVMTLLPAPFGGAIGWDVLVVVFLDGSFVALLNDDVRRYQGTQESFSLDDVASWFGLDRNEIDGWIPAIVESSTTVGNN